MRVAFALQLLGLVVIAAFAGVSETSRTAGDEAGEGLDTSDVPRMETARAQFALAQRAKTALVGTLGRERMDRRWEAARAYAAVRVHFPGDACLGAEASFRAAELLRGGGDLVPSLREFANARVLCVEGPFSARAVLEIGHLHRRLGRPREALDAYQELYAGLSRGLGRAGRGAATGVRDVAMLWAGRVHQDAGRPEEAWRLWQRAAQDAEDPVHRVRAFDQLALALIDRGDLEGAAGMLERARGALSDLTRERTLLGERVRAALARMRAIRTLQRSVERRRGSVRIDGGDEE